MRLKNLANPGGNVDLLKKLAEMSKGESGDPAASGTSRPATTSGGPGTLRAPLPGMIDRPGWPVGTFPQPGASTPAGTFIHPGMLDLSRILPTLVARDRTATEMAEAAIELLNSSEQEALRSAVNTLKAKRLVGNQLANYLERRVRVGEVLQKLAAHWSQETRQDFAEAFQLAADKTDVMDLIVGIAILSDPELDDEIRAENLADASDDELVENRPIVWQHPPPGSVLEPPYMILVAVEHRDVAEAERAVDAILNQLTEVDGYRVTRTAAQRLRTSSVRLPAHAAAALRTTLANP